MTSSKPSSTADGAPEDKILGPLHAVKMTAPSKPALPAEMISTILDHLPISDLMTFARVSKRMQEMVYDDTRWVQRLRLMGCWDEAAARARFEESMFRRIQAQRRLTLPTDSVRRGELADRNVTEASAAPSSVTLFDANHEEDGRRQKGDHPGNDRSGHLSDGFETLAISSDAASNEEASASLVNPGKYVNILGTVQSIRGRAREEYGRVHGALAPYYFDLARSTTHTDAVLFQTFRDPEQQAMMLAQMRRFAKADITQGQRFREERLLSTVGIFEAAVLHEFEKGIIASDVDGGMRQYAYVLTALDGGHGGVEFFLRGNPLFHQREQFGNPIDCITQASSNRISLAPSHDFFDDLASALRTQIDIVQRVFPPTLKVVAPLLERVGRDIITEYINPLFDEAHTQGDEIYLQAVAGIFEQALRFAGSFHDPASTDNGLEADMDRALAQVFEPHMDLYFSEELNFFKNKANEEVSRWEDQLSQQDASTEAFFMANVNRQADKRDFLSSFKKVVMMPVNALPMSSPFGSSLAKLGSSTNGSTSHLPTSQVSTRSSTPGPVSHSSPAHDPHPLRPSTPSLNRALSSSPLPPDATVPTTELAAKAALMNSRLEGIRSLFSIEVALNLVHLAKASLERCALFVHLGSSTPVLSNLHPCSLAPPLSPSGEAAKLQCLTTFVLLLHVLGSRHIRPGFDTAVAHLSSYNPRSTTLPHGHPSGVAPLVTFLELVNVGDLIQQMVEVFYTTELVHARLADPNDFLDPAVKEKKRFEAMLDERVAAGLSRGIDVLMAEVEYIASTTQSPSDFNPTSSLLPSIPSASSSLNSNLNPALTTTTTPIPDLSGPTITAQQITELVSHHTTMLIGSTDKHTLDVFNQEVGLRLFSTLCKHLKRQRISVDGAMILMSDMQHYATYVQTLRNADLLTYFKALREVSQLYLIDKRDVLAGEMTGLIADGGRFHGVFKAEEVYEFAQRRADWAEVKGVVDRGLFGMGCGVM